MSVQAYCALRGVYRCLTTVEKRFHRQFFSGYLIAQLYMGVGVGVIGRKIVKILEKKGFGPTLPLVVVVQAVFLMHFLFSRWRKFSKEEPTCIAFNVTHLTALFIILKMSLKKPDDFGEALLGLFFGVMFTRHCIFNLKWTKLEKLHYIHKMQKSAYTLLLYIISQPVWKANLLKVSQ